MQIVGCYSMIKLDKKNLFSVVLFATMIGLIVYASIDKSRQDAELKASYRYTIGTTIESYYQYRGDKQIKYQYKVNGNTYTGFELYMSGVIEEGGRYYVKYAMKNPENCKMLYNYAVPKEIDSAPKEGWESMPRYIDTFIDL